MLKPLWFCLITGLFLGTSAHAAIPVIDFQPERGWMIVNGEERGATFTDATKDGETAGRVTWNAQHAPFFELHLTKPITLRPLETKVDATLRLELPAPPPHSVKAISLRLRDSRGEVFQWSHPITSRDRAPAITFKLTQDNHTDYWNTHGDATGVMQPPMELVGFSFQLAKDQQPGSIDLKQLVYARVDLPLAEVVAVDVKSNDRLHVLTLDDDPSPTLTVTNRSERAVKLDVQATLESFAGDVRTFNESFDLPAEATKPWRLPIELSRGIWWIDYTVQQRDTSEQFAGSTSLVRMQPTGPGQQTSGEFLFGVNAHSAWYTEPEQVLEARAAGLVGAKIARTGVDWSGVEPEQDRWNWTVLDRLVSLYGEQGIELQYTLAYTPRWASTAPPEETAYRIWSRMPPHLDQWGEYVETVVNRYRGKIRFWEVWNEPDLDFFRGSADDYLAMLAVAYERAKQANPDALVMSAGFSSRPDGEALIEKVLANGNDHIDVLAWHQHGRFENMKDILEGRVANLRSSYLPGKPWIMNECGFAVPDTSRASQRRQAETLVKKMTYLWSQGAIGHMWYQVRDDTRYVVGSERPFGMLMGDFAPKAAFPAYNTLTGLLSSKRFAGKLDLGDTTTGLEFADDHDRVVVLFTEREHKQLALRTDASEALAVDIVGEPTPLTVTEGQVVVNVTPMPGYVLLKGAAHKTTAGPSVLRLVSGNVFTGQPNSIQFELSNPFATGQQVTLTMHCEGATTEATQSIAANATQRMALTFDAPPTLAGKQQVPATVTYRFSSGLAGEMNTPLSVATPVMRELGNRAPDFTLDDPQHVVNMFNDDPYQAHKQWRGPQDLSARVWVAVDDDSLRIRVEAIDDEHNQPQTDELWQTDSVQIGLRIPGLSGFWELTAAAKNDGSGIVRVTQQPSGAADIASQIALTTTLRDNGVTYDLTIPRPALGLDNDRLAAGFGFSMLVNDSDNQEREGWIELTGGIGGGKDPSRFLTLVPR